MKIKILDDIKKKWSYGDLKRAAEDRGIWEWKGTDLLNVRVCCNLVSMVKYWLNVLDKHLKKYRQDTGEASENGEWYSKKRVELNVKEKRKHTHPQTRSCDCARALIISKQ